MLHSLAATIIPFLSVLTPSSARLNWNPHALVENSSDFCCFLSLNKINMKNKMFGLLVCYRSPENSGKYSVPIGTSGLSSDKLSKIPTWIKSRNSVSYKLTVHTHTQHDLYFKLKLFQAFPMSAVILFVISLLCLRKYDWINVFIYKVACLKWVYAPSSLKSWLKP